MSNFREDGFPIPPKVVEFPPIVQNANLQPIVGQESFAWGADDFNLIVWENVRHTVSQRRLRGFPLPGRFIGELLVVDGFVTDWGCVSNWLIIP
ncbi:MAG TPA: hypothetical protein VG099_09600 [Gemmataceae bacterium]|nr:hypothetical protein [Gemmataceae bacterium]